MSTTRPCPRLTGRRQPPSRSLASKLLGSICTCSQQNFDPWLARQQSSHITAEPRLATSLPHLPCMSLCPWGLVGLRPKKDVAYVFGIALSIVIPWRSRLSHYCTILGYAHLSQSLSPGPPPILLPQTPACLQTSGMPVTTLPRGVALRLAD